MGCGQVHIGPRQMSTNTRKNHPGSHLLGAVLGLLGQELILVRVVSREIESGVIATAIVASPTAGSEEGDPGEHSLVADGDVELGARAHGATEVGHAAHGGDAGAQRQQRARRAHEPALQQFGVELRHAETDAVALRRRRYLRASGRAEWVSCTNDERVNA